MQPDQQNPNPYNQSSPTSGSSQYPVVPAIPTVPNNGHSGHNPYEFIMASTTPKKSFWHGSGSSFVLRIALFVGIAAIVVTGVAIVLAALAPKGSTPGLTSMAARQQEILRITDIASRKVSGQETLNFVANVDASISTDKRQVVSFLTIHKVKLTPVMLARDYDAQTDTLLQNASSTNTYDTVVTKELTTQLQDYQKLALNTYKESKNRQAKQMLQTSYDNATMLLQQAKALPTTD